MVAQEMWNLVVVQEGNAAYRNLSERMHVVNSTVLDNLGELNIFIQIIYVKDKTHFQLPR